MFLLHSTCFGLEQTYTVGSSTVVAVSEPLEINIDSETLGKFRGKIVSPRHLFVDSGGKREVIPLQTSAISEAFVRFAKFDKNTLKSLPKLLLSPWTIFDEAFLRKHLLFLFEGLALLLWAISFLVRTDSRTVDSLKTHFIACAAKGIFVLSLLILAAGFLIKSIIGVPLAAVILVSLMIGQLYFISIVNRSLFVIFFKKSHFMARASFLLIFAHVSIALIFLPVVGILFSVFFLVPGLGAFVENQEVDSGGNK
jgi:hypothetical protein